MSTSCTMITLSTRRQIMRSRLSDVTSVQQRAGEGFAFRSAGARRPHGPGLAAILVFLAIAALVAGAAVAQAPDTPVTIGSVSLAAASRADTYWTEERMRDAKPMPVPELPASRASGLSSGTPAPAGLPVMASSGAPGDVP